MYDELQHYGILGMKWGVRRSKEQLGYRPTSPSALLANRANKKVNAGFKAWEENTKKREEAITLGKKTNQSRMAYARDPGNKELKREFKEDQKNYKKVLSSNTHYRQGVIRKEVGQDESRKYLSEAKKVKKQLEQDPSNKDLQKKYNSLMSEHAISRAKSRKAVAVGQKRSSKIASLKRARTMAIKGAVTATVLAGGAAVTNEILKKKGMRGISKEDLETVVRAGKEILNFAGYIY